MIIGYARTSTVEQTAGLEAQQRDLLALASNGHSANRQARSVLASRWKRRSTSFERATCWS